MTPEVDEPIEVVSYDPAWPQLFEKEAERVASAVSIPVGDIQHFGSTSVPGMAGKPVVDLLIGAENMEQGYKVAEEVAGIGYENLGEVLWPGRIYLRRRGPLNFNVVVAVHRGELWNYFITLRDYLRAHPDEVAAYTEAKWHAVGSGASMFLEYSHEKGPFLKEMAQRALRWRVEGGATA